MTRRRRPPYPPLAPSPASRYSRKHVLQLSRLAVIRFEWRFNRALNRGDDAFRIAVIRQHLIMCRRGMKGRLP